MKKIARALLKPLRSHPEIFHAIRSLARPPRELYQHLYFNGAFKVEVSERASFVINHFGAHIENDLFWAGYGGGWEGAELKLWRTLLEDADYVVDVGANSGVYALAAAALNPRRHVLALEPVPRIYEKLISNIALNSFNIRALQTAASNFDGMGTLFDTSSEHIYSASFDPSLLAGCELVEVSVPVSRLDSILAQMNWPRVDLIKIDVEKHEPAVLEGMGERLKNDRPTMLVEFLDDNIGRAINDLVQGLDYRYFAIDQFAGLVPTASLKAHSDRNSLLITGERWSRAVRPKVHPAGNGQRQ
jgi:FkbM family methyltransferase